MKKISLITIIGIALISCKPNNNSREINSTLEKMTLSGGAYGSTYNIIYYNNGSDLSEDIKKILIDFDNSVNTYKSDSKLSIFNNNNEGIEYDETINNLIQLSYKFNKITNGYYDPSVEPLSTLWGFNNKRFKNIPTENQVDSVMNFVGLDKIVIKQDSILKKNPKVQLSFNSMTGFVNDKVAEYFEDNNIHNYLIEIGGEVTAKGNKPNSTSWRVGIDEPNDNTLESVVKTVVTLDNEALATSGNYRKFHIDEKTGRKVVHTINPKTGYAISSNLLSSTVITKSTAEADAIATATMAMGYEKTVEFIKINKKMKFFLIWADESGVLRHEAFNGFKYEKIE